MRPRTWWLTISESGSFFVKVKTIAIWQKMNGRYQVLYLPLMVEHESKRKWNANVAFFSGGEICDSFPFRLNFSVWKEPPIDASTIRIVWTKECDTKCDHTVPFLLKWAAFCDRVDCSIIPRIAPQDPIKGGKLSMISLPPEHRICDFWCSFHLKSGKLECSA